MENAVEALIMAGETLIFIIALTVCISSYTTVREQIDEIMGSTETIAMAKESGEYINFIQSKNNGSVRNVGAETVVSSMTRAIKENYVVYIKLLNYSSVGTEVDTIDATVDITINGKKIISVGDKIIKVTNGYDTNQNVNEILKKSFYNAIKDKKFSEYLGEYQDDTAAGVSTENKEVRRIITYVENS